jgi:cupin fold WbuC family metalloprotein
MLSAEESRTRRLFAAAVSLALVLFVAVLLFYPSSAALRRYGAVSPHSASHGEELGLELQAPLKVIHSAVFAALISAAAAHPRKRKMTDLTWKPERNSLQVLLNTWTEGSLSPVHAHVRWSESFVVLDGALALFTWDLSGETLTCTVLSQGGSPAALAEAGTWHAMAAAPRRLGWPGHAVVLEQAGHVFDAEHDRTKLLAPFAPSLNDGLDGDPQHFAVLFNSCQRNGGA